MDAENVRIDQVNDPDKRVSIVFDLAAVSYGDPELADAFMNERHRGLLAKALGFEEDDFVNPKDVVRKSIEGTLKVVDYLEHRHS